MSFWSAGPCGNTNAFAGIVAGLSIGLAASLVESPGYSPIGLHWAYGQRLDDGSRMSGDVQVRFCERLGVKFPRATHLVLGFEHREDAERLLTDLLERFAQFGLAFHPDKTRLLEFGRYATERRQQRGEGKPATFNFLGFTHICGKTRTGKFTVLRQTMRRRWQGKLKAVATELRQRLHQPIPEVGAYLRDVVRGHFQYYGVPMNTPALCAFRYGIGRVWRQVLGRRSQTAHVAWTRMVRLLQRWLPAVRVCHPYPLARFAVMTQGKNRMR